MVRLAALERRLQHLEDLEAVRAVLLAYPVAVDSHDLAALERLFDARAHLVSRAECHGRAEVLAYYTRFFESNWRATRHYISNLSIQVAGAMASATSYYHQTAVVDGRSVLGWGTYTDTLVRADDGWRIREKVNRVLAMTELADGWANDHPKGVLDAADARA